MARAATARPSSIFSRTRDGKRARASATSARREAGSSAPASSSRGATQSFTSIWAAIRVRGRYPSESRRSLRPRSWSWTIPKAETSANAARDTPKARKILVATLRKAGM